MIMSAVRFLLTRRRILATSAAGGAVSLLNVNVGIAAAEGDAIRPFGINIPEDQLVDFVDASRPLAGPIGRRSQINHRLS